MTMINDLQSKKKPIIERLSDDNLPRFVELIRLFEVVFEMENFQIPGNDHLQKVLSRPGFSAFVAIIDGRIVGGLTTYVLDQYYYEKPLAYLYDLAVDTQLQRQGIGKQLVEFTNKYYQALGFEEVFVQAEQTEKDTLAFYRATKPTAEEDVAHFYYKLT